MVSLELFFHESPPASLKLMLSDKKQQHRSNGFRQSNIRYSAVKQSVMAVKSAERGLEEGKEKPLSPFNACDEEHQISVDLGAVDESVNVAGVDGLSRLKAGSANPITCYNINQTTV